VRGAGSAYGGSGNDVIHGSDQANRLYGQDGDDTIYTANGRDEVWGGRGTDIVFASNSDFTVPNTARASERDGVLS